MTGLYFEEFHEGQVFEHSLSRTVTEMDNVLFSSLPLNPQPLHLDEEFAKTTEFGQRIVNSLFTLGLMIGMSVGDTTLGTTIANLGMNKVEFPKPVFHGDTIRARSIVRSLRASKSRPEAGVVEFEHQAFNQRGEMVATCLRAAFMKRRPGGGLMRGVGAGWGESGRRGKPWLAPCVMRWMVDGCGVMADRWRTRARVAGTVLRPRG